MKSFRKDKIMLNEPLTISFIGTKEIKDWLEKVAREDERSVSFIIRKLIEKEIEKETQQKTKVVSGFEDL